MVLRRLVDAVESIEALVASGEAPKEGGSMPIAMTPIEVAQHLRKSRAWVYQRMADGSLPFLQVSPRRRLIRREDLEEFLISRRG